MSVRQGATHIQAGSYCANTVFLGSDGFGFTLSQCATEVVIDTRCVSGFFYMNVNAGQCKCATDDCASRGSSGPHDIFFVAAFLGRVTGTLEFGHNLSIPPIVVWEGQPSVVH